MCDTLVISGGSTASLLLIGKLCRLWLDNLIELKNVKNFAGTSAGAIICYLLILGYTPAELGYTLATSNIWDNFQFVDILSALTHRNSLFSSAPIRNELERLTLNKCTHLPTFSELEQNLLVCTINVNKSELVYLSKITHPDMVVIDALMLSCAIPYLFEEQNWKNERYIDGGLFDNCPVEACRKIFTCKQVCVLKLETRETGADTFSRFFSLVFTPRTIFDKLCEAQYENVNMIKLATPLNKSTPLRFYNLQLNKEKVTELFIRGYYS